jgi:hypothetical protein
LVSVESQVSTLPPKPEPAGHEYVVEPAGTGRPGVVSSQSNPSRWPVPVHVVHETSFSPVIFTHFWLRHWLSAEQKQPPAVEQVLVVPLQWPNGHTKPLAPELGQPPSGQGIEAAPVSAPPSLVEGSTHALFSQISSPVHARPQPLQLAESFEKFTQVSPHWVKPGLHWNVHALLTQVGDALATLVEQALPHVMQFSSSLVRSTQLELHTVGVAAGHVPVHPKAPLSGSAAQSDASPPHVLPQAPQLVACEGSSHPASHSSWGGVQAGGMPASPSSRPPSSPPSAVATVPSTPLSGCFGGPES